MLDTKPTIVKPTLEQIEYQRQHIHDNRVDTLIAANVICFSLGFIAVCMRLVSRRMANIEFKADDWFIVCALILTASVMFCEMLALRWGFGKHTIVGTNPADTRKTMIAAEFLYGYGMFFVKASILYLYHRIFFVSRTFTKVGWAVGLFVFGYSGILAIAATLQCFPLRHIWDPSVEGYCLAIPLASTILAVFNVVTDIIVIAMPLPLLWKMQTANKEKLQITGIFLLGGFVMVCSIVRAAIVHELSWTDPNWDIISLSVWTTAELGIGIVSACLPTLRPLFAKVVSKCKRPSAESSIDSESPFVNRPRGSESNIGSAIQRTPSCPAHSSKFSHLGVLGDLEIGSQDHAEPETKP